MPCRVTEVLGVLVPGYPKRARPRRAAAAVCARHAAACAGPCTGADVAADRSAVARRRPAIL
jgi:hypothetical protein